MYTKVDCNLDYSPLFAMKALSMPTELSEGSVEK